MNTYFKSSVAKYLTISLFLSSVVSISQGAEKEEGSNGKLPEENRHTHIRAKKRLTYAQDDTNHPVDPSDSNVPASPEVSSVKKPKTSIKKKRTLDTKSDDWQNIQNSLTEIQGDENDSDSDIPFVHDYPESTRQVLANNGLNEKGIVLAAILNSSLHKDMRSPLDPVVINYSALSPAKVKHFFKLGGTILELQKAVQELKTNRPEPIVNPDFKKEQLFTPVSKVLLSRTETAKVKKAGVLQSLPATAHVIDQVKLSSAESEALKQAEYAKFIALELIRGNTEDHLKAEMQRENNIFAPYLSYIEARKKELGGDSEIVDDESEDDSEGVLEDTKAPDVDAASNNFETPEEAETNYTGRFTKSELETKFEEFTKGHLTHINVCGYDVYFSRDMIDLARMQKTGYSNEDIMQELGGTPIGADGRPMNYHHLTHYDHLTHRTKSIIVLLSGTLHQEKSGLWHFSRATYRLPITRVKRNLFDPTRKFFNKAIVKLLSE